MGEFLREKGEVAVFTSGGDDHQSFPFGTREGGFREVLEQNYPEIKIMTAIQTKEKNQIIRREMRKLCERENMPDGIFITCGGVNAIGDVLQEYEKKNVKVISFESYPEILTLMKEDIVTATLDSEIEAQGQKAVEVMMDYLIYGKKPEKKHMYSETKILLKESLEE